MRRVLTAVGILAVVTLTACGRQYGATTAAGAAGIPALESGATSYVPAPGASVAPVASSGVEVAAHAFAANASGTSVPVLATPAVLTPARDSLILVQVLTQNVSTLASIGDNMGNAYRRIGVMHTYAGVPAGTVLFACNDAKGGPGQVWSLVKTEGHAADEASIYVMVLSGAGSIGAWSFSNTVPYGTASPITTKANGSIVVSFWGPADYSGSATNPNNPYTAPSGWVLAGQNNNSFNQNSGAFAWRRVAREGTVIDPSWSSRHSLENTGSMWLVEVTPRLQDSSSRAETDG